MTSPVDLYGRNQRKRCETLVAKRCGEKHLQNGFSNSPLSGLGLVFPMAGGFGACRTSGPKGILSAGNNVGPEGARALGEALKLNATLQRILLGGMTPPHVRGLAHDVKCSVLFCLQTEVAMRCNQRFFPPSSAGCARCRG